LFPRQAAKGDRLPHLAPKTPTAPIRRGPGPQV